MKKEFVMRGKTDSGSVETLNFSGHKKGYAYRLKEFQLYASTNVAGQEFEGVGSITAAKTAEYPYNPNFNNEGLIGTAATLISSSSINPLSDQSVINDTFLITQNLILKVRENAGTPVNWQCKFEAVKMSGPEEAVTNYRQYLISDE